MLFLHSLQAAATIDLVPMAPLEKILSGRGNLDVAQDGIDLVAFYRAHAKVLVGKTPIAAAHVEELETLSHDVRELLAVDGNLKAARPEDVALARSDRQRIWTLLVEAHAQLVILGTVGFGPQKAQELVPSLQSRQGLPKPKPAPVKKETEG